MFKKPFLIAEVGINHNGSVATAKKRKKQISGIILSLYILK